MDGQTDTQSNTQKGRKTESVGVGDTRHYVDYKKT